MPGMFGSTPFIFKRPAPGRRLNEERFRLRRPVQGLASGAVVASIYIYIASVKSVLLCLTKAADYSLRAARGEYERATTHCADRGRCA
jgi:hypothetical protein